jgi:DNA-binding MarR family transcriptional regulator
MSFKELGERTLITKGTLTGVVDRLVAQGLVRRVASTTDGRSQIAQLTPEGDALFQRIFPEHLAYLRAVFGNIDSDELSRTESALSRLRQLFQEAS